MLARNVKRRFEKRDGCGKLFNIEKPWKFRKAIHNYGPPLSKKSNRTV